MDYRIFKPGDKVRGTGIYEYVSGTVLFSHERCIVIQTEKNPTPEQYIKAEFEKIPERTSKFRNVYNDMRPIIVSSYWPSREKALNDRPSGTSFIGMFEQVFKDGQLVDTIYHPG